MANKKTTTTTSASNGGSQIFLSQDAQDAIAEIQFIMASQSPAAMQKYGGRGGKSLVIDELAKGALAVRSKMGKQAGAESLADKTS
jgi:hypothetical protein